MSHTSPLAPSSPHQQSHAHSHSTQERKYFDSGDYALSKAGKASDTGINTIGTEHPTADAIPHLSPLTNQLTRNDSISAGSPPSVSSPISGGGGDQHPAAAGLHRGSINGIPGGGLSGHGHPQSHSPVKESSYLARSASMDDGGQGVMGTGANTITTSKDGDQAGRDSMSPPVQKAGIPIRR